MISAMSQDSHTTASLPLSSSSETTKMLTIDRSAANGDAATPFEAMARQQQQAMSSRSPPRAAPRRVGKRGGGPRQHHKPKPLHELIMTEVEKLLRPANHDLQVQAASFLLGSNEDETSAILTEQLLLEDGGAETGTEASSVTAPFGKLDEDLDKTRHAENLTNGVGPPIAVQKKGVQEQPSTDSQATATTEGEEDVLSLSDASIPSVEEMMLAPGLMTIVEGESLEESLTKEIEEEHQEAEVPIKVVYSFEEY